jgi:hypothetical protein
MSTTMKNAMERMSYQQWLDEGKRRFGADFLKWRFVCPSCGHVQAVEDFRPFKDAGATADSARSECIGRYMGAKVAFDAAKWKPCNYALFGLFRLKHVEVEIEGKPEPSRSFHFAEAAS